MEDENSYNWVANTTTSSIGGILTAIIGITFWIIKNKCRHMTSKCDSGCFSCTSREDTRRDTVLAELEAYRQRRAQSV